MYQIWNINAQCRWDHYAGDRHYFGAEALYVKIRQIRAQCRWDHYAGDWHYFGAEAMWFPMDHIISLALRHLREIT